MKRRSYDGTVVEVPVGKYAVVSAVALAIILAFSVAGAAGCKEYNRYQKRADAANRTKVVKQEIQTAAQQALIVNAQIEATKARAQMRREEAKGIRDAQDTIQATLTDKYLVHEAIESQRAIATSGKNNTVIYVPSDRMGTPVMTMDAAAGALGRMPPAVEK